MESNKTIKNLVLLIFDQCKEQNCSLVNVNKIVEYITPNFDLNSEEAGKLQLSKLFALLKEEGKDNNSLISEEQFENILQLWIPSIQCCDSQLMDEISCEDESIFSGSVHQRLSRSLTNLKQHIDNDREHRLSFCHSWLDNNLTNDENSFPNFRINNENNCDRSQSLSPHDDPFKIPINCIRSTPLKRKTPGSSKITCLQQPNLRHIKLQHLVDQSSYSDSDAMYHMEGSYIEDDSSENIGSNKEINKSHIRRKRHRSSVLGQSDFDTIDNRDLLSQLKQIKFKNSQLIEINDRLQVQLESAEENLRNLSTKCLNLEKKSKLYNTLSEENEQFVLEIDDIRKCLEKEVEYRRNLLSEKIMTEGELSMSKEHIQSLVDKLSLLDAGLEEKDMMIENLRSMISQQQEFCSKLQDLNLEKDDAIVQNEKSMRELTEVIKEYEEKLNILAKEKETLQTKFRSLMIRDDLSAIVNKMEAIQDSTKDIEDIGCSGGFDEDSVFRYSSKAEYLPCVTNSPWSIKVELATQLVDSRGDNPFCEKMFIDSPCSYVDDSDEGSFNMLKELLIVLSSLRMTLAQYKDHLETASITMKGTEHFSDDITLSYISYLDDSINLLGASTEKAARCQNQFNETFEFLMKRISNLKNERKSLQLKNEQLQIQVGDSFNNIDIDVAEKICFLEDELRKERLSATKKEQMIQDFLKAKDTRWRFGRCCNCGRSSVRFSVNSDSNLQYLATEALNLERDEFSLQQKRLDIQRSFSNVENNTVYNNKDSWLKANRTLSRKSSISVDELLLQINQENHDSISKDCELPDDRNYYISTDDLADMTRYKLNMAQSSSIDFEKIIENSWLNTNTTMEERRASVFAQVTDNPMVDKKEAEGFPSTNGTWNEAKKVTAKQRTRSSSCSSSNDTSDANSIDVNIERQKLAQELENRNCRMQTRSPVPSSLSIPDDLKSITPTVNEDEQIRVLNNYTTFNEPEVPKHESRTNSPVSFIDECSATESAIMEIPSSSRRSSSNRLSVVHNLGDTTMSSSMTSGTIPLKQALPTISIVEVSLNDSNESYQPESYDQNNAEDIKHITSAKNINRSSTVESEGNSLQASMNKSNFSSRASSVMGDDGKLSRKARQGNKRIRRPYTIAGIGMATPKIIQDDVSSNCDEQSTIDGANDIQESIDLLQEMKETLSHLSPEDLESKFNEMSLIYRTDRPTVIDRANDVNKKCNKSLNNVEQEFYILRRLIEKVAQKVDQPCEFVPQLKASITVLEKCVEYLSAKSEILGAVEQEIKMSSIIDVMNEYNVRLTKQRDDHIRELEEAKSWRDSTVDISGNASFDQPRTKRSGLSGKDAKTRFQLAAQSTVMKSSIIRQFAANSFSRPGQSPAISDNHNSLEILKNTADTKYPFRRGTSNQCISLVDSSKLGSDMETINMRKYTAPKFFPSGTVADENGESLFQKGLHQGIRLSTDQALSEMRAEQSKFSSTLDSLSDMIEEFEPLEEGDVGDGSGSLETRIVAIKDTVGQFLANVKMFIKRSLYLVLGFSVIVALLIPWLLSPSTDQASSSQAPSFSLSSHRRPQRSLVPSIITKQPSPSPSLSPSPSPPSSSSFFPNVNVVRNGLATV